MSESNVGPVGTFVAIAFAAAASLGAASSRADERSATDGGTVVVQRQRKPFRVVRNDSAHCSGSMAMFDQAPAGCWVSELLEGRFSTEQDGGDLSGSFEGGGFAERNVECGKFADVCGHTVQCLCAPDAGLR